METFNTYKVLGVLVLIAMVGGCFFFYRMYQNDMRALTGFVASYERFDKAIADFSASPTDSVGSAARDAFGELDAKATFRLSSLIRHEKEVMVQAREVADISRRELDSLIAYKKAVANKNPGADTLAKKYADLSSERKSVYARLLGLSEE